MSISGLDGQEGPGPSCLSCLPRPLLSQHRFHACEIPPHRLHFFGRLELAHRLLNSHPEQLIIQLAFFRHELICTEIAYFRRLHSIFSCANRAANLVRIGSFAAASLNAARASFSLTPSISNSTRPGLTTATHCSGA